MSSKLLSLAINPARYSALRRSTLSPVLRNASFPTLTRLNSTLEGTKTFASNPAKDLPPVSHATQSSSASSDPCQVTILPNGIRVTTENTPGHFSAVGVYVDAGSRYETEETRGVSHILDRLAFKSTTNRTTEQMTTDLESLGGNIVCSSSRESIMYQSAVFRQDLPRMISLFADVVRNPLIDPAEVDEQRQTALYEIEEIWSKPEMILPEILHTAAYQNNTLGNPLLCPPEKLEVMAPEAIRSFRDTWYRPERMVIAAAGASHEELVSLAEEHFGDIPRSEVPLDSVETHKEMQRHQLDAVSSPSSPSSIVSRHPFYNTSIAQKPSLIKKLTTATASLLKPPPPPLAPPSPRDLATLPAYYTGGRAFIENPDLPHTHMQIAFEGLPIHNPDLYALATLQILLGGGGSFSAGGPGKGMYSRLFTNVLNQYHWVESCVAFNHCYTDSGLFGISASCRSEYNNLLLEVVCHELDLVTRSDMGPKGVTEPELRRAKNQLKSSLLMNLESRMVQLEDLGRQVQVAGKKTPVAEMLAKIEEVDLETLRRVAGMVVRGAVKSSSGGSGEVTVVAQGDLRGLKDATKVAAKYGLGTGAGVLRWGQ
ncbi:Metalloenzyme, LuxS/M16 peptidase-like protein [Jimgerdemannia flammicorona]|uniref:Mitochondrial-processing peptidase subunit alpha n=2 Tax=Jimgerdemannia flammicorona TaxID=994334 RepID=A0A433BT70_9FUNG|nr:Metalloenzyme, LuxS/M16 peptidase-like protein [Jimgerdemannia flammicorona]RUS29770.1 Metalloenzyme, LuxS/M16 peptidase-like protein [Jimgerdemannia flammicorona]